MFIEEFDLVYMHQKSITWHSITNFITINPSIESAPCHEEFRDEVVAFVHENNT